jgi:hypothetical protein
MDHPIVAIDQAADQARSAQARSAPGGVLDVNDACPYPFAIPRRAGSFREEFKAARAADAPLEPK